MTTESITEQKTGEIKRMVELLKSASTQEELEQAVRELSPDEVLRVARLTDKVPRELIVDYYNMIIEAAKIAFKMLMEYCTDLCGLIQRGGSEKELRALSYMSVLHLYSDIVNPRTFLPDSSVTVRDFYISKVNPVLNARYTQAAKDIETLKNALQEGVLEEASTVFNEREKRNLFEIVEYRALHTINDPQDYLAVKEAMMIKSPATPDMRISLQKPESLQ